MRARYGVFTPADANTDTENDKKMGSVEQGSHSDWKTWENGKTFSSQGKVRNFKQTGKVKEYHTQECIPVGCVPSAAVVPGGVSAPVHAGIHTPYANCHWALYTLYWYLHRSWSHFRKLCKDPHTRHFCYFRTKEIGSEIDSNGYTYFVLYPSHQTS